MSGTWVAVRLPIVFYPLQSLLKLIRCLAIRSYFAPVTVRAVHSIKAVSSGVSFPMFGHPERKGAQFSCNAITLANSAQNSLLPGTTPAL
jgi:hypothetical protein